MCGIVGAVSAPSSKEPDRHLLEQAVSALRHRGPDDSSVHMAPGISFGHTRLSIIDLERGSQPMMNEDRSVIAIYNADYADATSHGVVWRGAEDSISTIDNFSLNGRPRCVAGLSLSTTSINSGGGSITVAVTAPDAAQSTRIDSRSTSL